jgi:serine/threonine-protein kinase
MSDPLARLSSALADRYRLERELGAGGMATVYLAHDLKHNRKVAVKVLRPELAAALGHERFLREIEIAAGLSHPHILPLYDSGRTGGPADRRTDLAAEHAPVAAVAPIVPAEFLYYVMPYVEGESLRDRIRREKQLPLDDAMAIAREVADALSYAHARGIIHRDIKPENILLHSGHAVVADFGIARAVDAAGGDRLTETGLTIGTPSYMSPEQAAGAQDLDGRSDLYALGCVLYEMLAGQPPFTAPTAEGVVRQHITAQPPPITQLRPAVPAAVAGVLQRALAKNPADRFNPVAQFADALGQQRGLSYAPVPPPRRWLVPAGVGAIVVALGIVGVMSLRGPAERFAIGGATQVTLDPGLEVDAAISPDGAMVAYAAGPPTHMQIYVRQVSGGRTVSLTDDSTTNHRWPRWSPDGTRVAFTTGRGTIEVVPAFGGPARVVARVGIDTAAGLDWIPVAGFDWSPDGQRVAYITGWPAGVIYLQDLAGGEPVRVTTVEQAHAPVWSPDGTRLAVVAGNAEFVMGTKYFANEGQSGISIVPLNGDPPVTVTEQTAVNIAPAWTPDGRGLLFVSDRDGTRDVFRVAIPRSGPPRGAPERLTTGLGAFSLTVSGDGTRLAYASLQTTSNVWSIAIPGSGPVPSDAARAITVGNQTVESMDVSADGRWLIFDSNRSGNYDIWRMPTEGGEPVQLTSNPSSDFAPRWSRDGHAIVFHSLRHGNRDIFTINPDGTGELRRTTSPAEELDVDWSPDGTALVHQTFTGQVNTSQVLDLATGSERDLWTGEYARWSPRGDEILTISAPGLVVGPAAGGTPRVLVPRSDPASGPYLGAWSPDARTVYYLLRDATGWSIRSISAGGGASRLLITFDDAERQPSRYGFTTDGRRFYFTLGRRESDVWVAEVELR